MARGEDWSDTELDAIVADYFAMLRDEIGGISFSKTAHRRALVERVDRSEGSIEFKHCNITAVLEELGVAGIRGYRARANYQGAILEAIERHLDRDGGRDLSMVPTASAPTIRMVDVPGIELRNEPPPAAVQRMVRRFDPVERDMRNRELGLAGEHAVLSFERQRLDSAGRPDLAARVRHVLVEIGDGLGYDIASFSELGDDLAIEVKTTRGVARTPFFMSPQRASGRRADGGRVSALSIARVRPEARPVHDDAAIGRKPAVHHRDVARRLQVMGSQT